MRQEYAYDKNPVEFDVASFVQPDEDTITDEETTRRRNQRRRRISKNNDYNSVFGLNMDEGNSGDVNQDYLSLGDPPAKLNPTLLDLGPTVLKDSLNIKKFKMNAMDESNAKYTRDNIKNQIVMPEPNPAHNPQKKCILKSLKLPFFPRSNKTESLKPKKTRKRKLFCFKCSKEKSKDKFEQNGVQVDLIPENKKIKRSYEENMCPACKKKFITFESNENSKPWNKKWHNRLISEKCYDTNVKEYPRTDTNKYTKFNSDDFGDDTDDNQRNKREEPGILMRRELDVIQQMIEHDDVRLPSSAKTTGPPPE
ncbi:unnamed protein product [Arctia plantaginis]|uniref:Uncharacterized protein n=1 Tax=Arctia plantaginis TaxID=874455 RepID=A0A8S0Z7S7_ARCPL|nr:unnamed protein product [Arctia plantaginis]CAB3228213.1 unnamed protein product [Arctia plantaginis]